MKDSEVGSSIQLVNQWWQKARSATTMEELERESDAAYKLLKGMCSKEFNPIAAHLVSDLLDELRCRIDPVYAKKYKEKFK